MVAIKPAADPNKVPIHPKWTAPVGYTPHIPHETMASVSSTHTDLFILGWTGRFLMHVIVADLNGSVGAALKPNDSRLSLIRKRRLTFSISEIQH
jgi:hypothetical protein